jgi:acyl-CoA reductase-like NAD-dependent aldehyde dehydrogenase
VLGGNAPDKGLFFPLTLIADVDNGNPLVEEEQFGPVLPIIRFSDISEVIERANDNPNGLGGSVWSKDIGKAKEIALPLECGTAWINKHSPVQPDAPFGGVKSSGLGRAFGEEGLFEKTEVQVIWS